MRDIYLRYDDSNGLRMSDSAAPVYANRLALQFYNDFLENPEYCIVNRNLPTTEHTLSLKNVNKTKRDSIFDMWYTTLEQGKNTFSLLDHKKRTLFDCLWPSWKETWKKSRGGVYDITIDIRSPFPWTPPMFAFYPFNDTYGWNDLYQESVVQLDSGAGGTVSLKKLVLTETGSPTYAARNTDIRWYQQKDNSSISLLAQFQVGEIVAGATIDILKLSDGSNTLKIYANYSAESSSSPSSVSESSSSISSSSSLNSSSSSLNSSSSSVNSSSSASISASSSSSLSSSSSSSSSSSLSSSNSSQFSSSSSTSQGFSSSSSSSPGPSSSSSSASISGGSSSSYSLVSGSSLSSSSLSSSSLSSSSSSSSSSSVEGSSEMTIGFLWQKAGESAEYISIDEVNNYSNGQRAWYDVCGTFDNYNNKFYLYVKRSGDTTKTWSYVFDYLHGTTSLTGTPENCLISDTSPTNYPEDVTWSSLYLLNGSQTDVYVVNADKAQLNYAMIIDDFIPPAEFNWFRRLFHYWVRSGEVLPR